MTKPELVAHIMAATAEYKKTHLMEMPKATLEVIADQMAGIEVVGVGGEPQAVVLPTEEVDAQGAPKGTADAADAKEKDTGRKQAKINEAERKMLATIPRLLDFAGVESVMDGKGFLMKVHELHGLAPTSTKSLFVALKRKGFIQIIGKKSGQKKTTLRLLEKGIQYLLENGLIDAA